MGYPLSEDWCLYCDIRNVFFKKVEDGVVIHTRCADKAAWYGSRSEAFWVADRLPASTVKDAFVPAHVDSFVNAEDPD